ncbi:MAG TPA: YdeI/OmpD-associated family protein [Kofleriaceae bacterium]
MAYREQWLAEIEALEKILAGFDLRVETKWAKPCYMLGDENVVIIQTFKEYIALGFFQGALLKDPKKVLVQLGSVQAARVMKFTTAKEIASKAPIIKSYMREAIAAATTGAKVESKPRVFDMPAELETAFKKSAKLRKAFEALTPGRQRGWLYHFTGAKQSETRVARIEKAMPAILEGRGMLER